MENLGSTFSKEAAFWYSPKSMVSGWLCRDTGSKLHFPRGYQVSRDNCRMPWKLLCLYWPLFSGSQGNAGIETIWYLPTNIFTGKREVLNMNSWLFLKLQWKWRIENFDIYTWWWWWWREWWWWCWWWCSGGGDGHGGDDDVVVIVVVIVMMVMIVWWWWQW